MSWKGPSGPRGPSGNPNGPKGEDWLDWGKYLPMKFVKYLPVGRDIFPAHTYRIVVCNDLDLGRTVNLLFFMDKHGDEMNDRKDFRFNAGTILVMQEDAL